jgi:predicted RecB family nuclease
MKQVEGALVTSATDLATFMGCRHAVVLDKRRLIGAIDKPFYNNPTLEALKEKGVQHEARYLKHLQSAGQTGVCLQQGAKMTDVVAAMRAGAQFIYQARLEQGSWRGYADFLIKADKPSDLGDWSYEVLDAKLAKETRGETILQLCVYSELLSALQGVWSDHAHVLTPASLTAETYRLAEYSAYYRLVKKGFTEFLPDAETRASYPEPCEKCDRCDWYTHCEKQWRGMTTSASSPAFTHRNGLNSRNMTSPP